MAKYGVLLSQYSEVHCKVIPIINRCLEGMKSASQLVNGPKVRAFVQDSFMVCIPMVIPVELIDLNYYKRLGCNILGILHGKNYQPVAMLL